MNKAVLILMTTYNGNRYLSRQLDSIMNQSYKNWKLIIRDDGSVDGSTETITKYAKQDNLRRTDRCPGPRGLQGEATAEGRPRI